MKKLWILSAVIFLGPGFYVGGESKKKAEPKKEQSFSLQTQVKKSH